MYRDCDYYDFHVAGNCYFSYDHDDDHCACLKYGANDDDGVDEDLCLDKG